MKATLKLNYPHFRAELVSFKDEVPTLGEVPVGEKLVLNWSYSGAALNIYSKFKQVFTGVGVNGSKTVPSDTAVLVVMGSVTTGEGKTVRALEYIKPQKTAISLKGKASILLIR
jgi:hypothetical protein